MREDAIDISGLPIHYVNKTVPVKLEDGSVAVVCGFKLGECFTPLYVAVSPAGAALEGGKSYVETAHMAHCKSH
jgi:hypothetical protein